MSRDFLSLSPSWCVEPYLTRKSRKSKWKGREKRERERAIFLFSHELKRRGGKNEGGTGRISLKQISFFSFSSLLKGANLLKYFSHFLTLNSAFILTDGRENELAMDKNNLIPSYRACTGQREKTLDFFFISCVSTLQTSWQRSPSSHSLPWKLLGLRVWKICQHWREKDRDLGWGER